MSKRSIKFIIEKGTKRPKAMTHVEYFNCIFTLTYFCRRKIAKLLKTDKLL